MNTALPSLWLADIAPALRAEWRERHAAWLSPTEQARLARIERAERRAQLVAGHVLLRRLAGARAGIAAREVCVESFSDGRPQLVAPSGWQASLAHSRHWVAALLVRGTAQVGLDIELMQAQRQIEAIAQLACGVVAESREHAYLVWAHREAAIKAGAETAGAWVATWQGHALAVCTHAPPEVALVDLATESSPSPVVLHWTAQPPLSLARSADGP